MQIQLQQPDIEIAIRRYMLEEGITRPIDTIDFKSTRKGDNNVEADIKLASAATVSAPIVEEVPPSSPEKEKVEKAPTAKEEASDGPLFGKAPA